MTSTTPNAPALRLRSEPWGGLALDRRHDRVWGFGREEFASLRAAEPEAVEARPTDDLATAVNRSGDSPLMEEFLASYGPDAEGLANPYAVWGSEYFIGTAPSPEECRLRAPISVSWSVTNRCQSACKYCCTESHPRAHYGIDTDSLLHSVDLLAQWGALRLIVGGGEPLLRDDILTVLDHANRRGLRPTLATNGLSVPDMDPSSLRDVVMLMQVSLDSLREPVYRALRGTRDGVTRVVSAIRALRRLSIPVRVVTVLTQKNEEDLESLADFLNDEGVHQWFVFVVQPSGRGSLRFENYRPLNLDGAIQRLAELDDRHDQLSVSLWGAQPEDQLAVALDSTGELTLHDYGTGLHQRLTNLDRAEVSDLDEMWRQVPPSAQWNMLVNFTRADRRVRDLAGKD